MSSQVRNVFCFGGSIVDGYGADGVSWAHRLKQDYYVHNAEEGMKVPQLPQFHTLGISSSTAEDVRRQAPLDLESRLHVRHRWKLPTLSILSIGHSDARLSGNPPKPKTTLPDFIASIDGIAEQFTACDPGEERRMLFVGLTACDDSVVYDRRGTKVTYDNEILAEYEAAACKVFRAYGGVAVPLLVASLEVGFGKDYLSPDGLHPDAKGQGWIYQKVKGAFHDLTA